MKRISFIFWILCLIYFISAVFINLFGQASISMMNFLSTSHSNQGLILTYQAIAGIITALFLSAYGESFDKKKTILFGSICISIGSIFVFLSSFLNEAYSFIFISLMISNIGYTTIDLTMNSLISEIYKDEKNKYIPIIHIFFGLGSMFTPIFYIFFANNYINKAFAYAYLAIGIFSILLSILFVTFNNKAYTNIIPNVEIKDHFEIFKEKNTWYLLLVAFLYAIYQNGFSSWVSDYNISYRNINADTSGLIITIYFAFALLMRLLSTKLLSKIKVTNYYFMFGILSSLLLIIGFNITNNYFYYVMIALAGFMQGGLVPSFFIISSNNYPRRESSSSSLFILALNISNLLAKTFGLIIEQYTHKSLMIIISICLLTSSILLKTLIKEK